MLLSDLIWKYGCIGIFLQESLFKKLLSVPSSSTPIPHIQLKGRGSIPAGYALKWRFPGFPVEFLQTLQILSCREILIFSNMYYSMLYCWDFLMYIVLYLFNGKYVHCDSKQTHLKVKLPSKRACLWLLPLWLCYINVVVYSMEC